MNQTLLLDFSDKPKPKKGQAAILAMLPSGFRVNTVRMEPIAASGHYVFADEVQGVCLVAFLVWREAVLAELYDIAAHVVQSPGVWRLHADWTGRSMGIAAKPGMPDCLLVVGVIAPVGPRGCAGSAGILPLGFGGQAGIAFRRRTH